MFVSKKTFRIFVSSTFSDMRSERRILQEKVFPRLQVLCESHGANFQPVDLRWGVSEETQLDQRTMDLCLGEIARCQKLSPRPNFIILLGDRYGWQPIPARIPSDEMFIILDAASSDARILLESWYREDLNAIPSEHVLLSREDEYRSFDRWVEIENLLRNVLRDVVATLPFTQDQLIKYFASATHQEIIHGALNTPLGSNLAEEHVFTYIRTSRDLPENAEAREFIDLAKDVRDPYAKEQLANLSRGLREKLSPEHVYDYQGAWTPMKGLVLDDPNAFEDRVYADLKRILEEELEEIYLPSALEREVQSHKELKGQLIEHFTGRVESLADIATYLCSSSSKPYSIIGASGSGKTTLMAQAIHDMGKGTGKVIYRFIGTSMSSSSLNQLLLSLIEEISTAYGVDKASLFQEGEEESWFNSDFGLNQLLLRSLELASEDNPLFIFLDALDQLATKVDVISLDWLPAQLPPNVCFVVSALPGLQEKLEKITDVIELPIMPIEDGTILLDKWLNAIKRTIRPQQRNKIDECFSKHGLPLCLKLAFEQVKEWHSYSTDATVADTIKGMLTDYFDNLERKHGCLFVSKVCAYLLSGRYQGLSERDLLGLMIFDQEYWRHFLESSHPDHRNEVEEIGKLPVIIWSRLFLDLKPFLSEREAGGVSIISFYHRSFIDYARKRYNCNPDKNHSTLANFFALEPLFLDEKEQIPNMRKLIEQPYQQTLSRQWDDLIGKSLANLKFLKAKCKAGIIYDLMSDYALAEYSFPSQEPKDSKFPIAPKYDKNSTIKSSCNEWTKLTRLQAWRQFVNTHIWQLDKGVEPIFQMAWNSTDSGPVADLLAELEIEGKGISTEWLRLENRPIYSPNPLCIKVLELNPAVPVLAISITPDFKRAISGSSKGRLWLWNLESGEPQKILIGHSDIILAVSMTPDGSRAITGSKDCTICFWNLENGTRINIPTMHTGPVNSVNISPNGRVAVSASSDKLICIWDLELGRCINVLKGHSKSVSSAYLSYDCKYVLSGGEDGTLRLWDIESGVCVKIIKSKTPINAVFMTQNATQAISISFGLISVWDMETGECILKIGAETGKFSYIAVTPDGTRAISTSFGNTLCLWNLNNGKLLKVLRGHTGPVNAVAISLGGEQAVSGGRDNTLRVWDIASGKSLKDENENIHFAPVSSVAITPIGNKAVSGSWDGTIRIWDVKSNHTLNLRSSFNLDNEKVSISSIAITLDGQSILSCGQDKGLIKIWNLYRNSKRSMSGANKLEDLKRFRAIDAITVTPDGRKAVTGEWGSLRIWHITRRKMLKRQDGDGHFGKINTIVITPDGKKIISGGRDKTIRIWDINSLDCLNILEGHLGTVYSISITPDGKQIVSGSKDGTIRVWEIESGKCIKVLEEHSGPVSSVSITPDGRHVVSGGKDRAIRMWDLESGKCIALCIMESMVFCVTAHCAGIIAGESSGKVDFISIENYCPDSPLITAARLWLSDLKSWDIKLTILCPWCGNRFDADHFFNFISPDDDSQIMRTSQSTYNLKSIDINCPSANCGKPLRLNPFVCDNRPNVIREELTL